MSARRRYQLDDLRQVVAALFSSLGVAPGRAGALAGHFLWFETAGVPRFGLETLAEWRDRIENGEVDPKAEGELRQEHAATAVFDAERGLGPLMLGSAASVAAGKARECGIAVVRVTNLGHVGPPAPVASEIALGPMVAAILGPGAAWSLAVPTAGGLPVVRDAAFGAMESKSVPRPNPALSPWHLLVPEGDWLVQVLYVPALESLAGMHEHVTAALEAGAAEDILHPSEWEKRRAEAWEYGVTVPGRVWESLERWLKQAGVELPKPLERAATAEAR